MQWGVGGVSCQVREGERVGWGGLAAEGRVIGWGGGCPAT